MAGTACLAIGVGDAPPLDYLRGAVNGAKAIAGWAREQGFETRLLTDDLKPIERADVTAALVSLLKPVPEALVLYFAGHGLSRAAGDDLWLLSRWEAEERAVLVNGLRDRLSWHGLQRLILVSDACRSPVDFNAQMIEGDSLLGRGTFDEFPPQLDLWYAASRGRAAFMIPGGAPDAMRCIFSGLLAEALAGAHDGAFDSDDPARPITSFRLADFLEREVPARATRYGVTLKPVITTSIRPPKNRYRPGPPAIPPVFPPWPEPGEANPSVMSGLATATRIAPLPGASWSTRNLATDAESLGLPEGAPLQLTRSGNATPDDSSKAARRPRWPLLAGGFLAVATMAASVWIAPLSSPDSTVGNTPSPVVEAPPSTVPDQPCLTESVPPKGKGGRRGCRLVRDPPVRALADAPIEMPSRGLETTLESVFEIAGWPIVLVLLFLSVAISLLFRRRRMLTLPPYMAAPSRSPAVIPRSDSRTGIKFDQLIAADTARNSRATAKADASIADTLAQFAAEERPDHFETGAGLVLSTATARRVLTDGRAATELLEDGRIVRLHMPANGGASPWWLGTIHLKAPLPLLVELSTGDWAASAALPHFVLAFGIGATGVETALYRAMYERTSQAAEQAMARLAASGLAGDQAPDVTQALRGGKHADPMMGVLAAWLHHAAGDIDNIRRTAFYFAQRSQPVPFDIALLGRLDARRSNDGLVSVVVPAVAEGHGSRATPLYMREATPPAQALLGGTFPFLRQGWMLLDPDGRGALYPPGLAELVSHLRPAPFTTFDAEGGRRLASLLFHDWKE